MTHSPAIEAFVALLPELESVAHMDYPSISLKKLKTIIAAAKELRDKAETEVVVPRFSIDERQDAWASLQMISEAIEVLFGTKAGLESEEATLLRGPEYHHRAEGIVEALSRAALAVAVLEEDLRDYKNEVERRDDIINSEKFLRGELQKDLASALEVLKPFADNFDHAIGRQGWPDNSPAGGMNNPQITNGHLRRAAAELARHKPTPQSSETGRGD